MRLWLALSLPLVAPVFFPSTAHAQDIERRFLNSTAQQPKRDTKFRLASIDVPSSPPAAQPVAPTTPTNPADPNQPATRVVPTGGRKPISYSVDTRFGFDKANVIIPDIIPFEVNVKRRIRTLVVSANYPLSGRTRISVNVPYISQMTRSSANNRSFTQRGNGIGDVSIWIDRSLPYPNKKAELGIAAGLALPTGRNPFNLGSNQLETGLGFYQPSVRLSARSTNVPLQFFGSVDYSPQMSRSISGQKRKLPASYGTELGFFYTIGPEWATQTSVSFGKSSSPVLQDSGTSVGYLTQALNYRTGDRTSFRGSVDVGLTDDSTDAYFGLSMNSSF